MSIASGKGEDRMRTVTSPLKDKLMDPFNLKLNFCLEMEIRENDRASGMLKWCVLSANKSENMNSGSDKNFVPLYFPRRSHSQEKQCISHSTSKMARHDAILRKHPRPKQAAQTLGSAQLLVLHLHKNFPVEVVSLKFLSLSHFTRFFNVSRQNY